MRVLMAAPFEAKGRYKGGISSVVNNMLLHKSALDECNLEIIKFNTCAVERAAGSDASFNKENIKNALYLYNTITDSIKENNPDILYYHSSVRYALLKDLLILRNAKINTKIRTVIHIHFADYEKIMTGNSLIDKLILSILKKYVDVIVFLSKTTMNSFVKHGIDRKKCTVIYNFNTLTLNESDISISNLNEDKPIRLLFVGTIGKRKGFFDLVKALERVDKNKYELHVCGEATDEESKELFEKCKNEMKKNLVFHGFVSGEERDYIYKKTDIMILPSYGEGLPMVILEAFSAGCAVISTNVGAIPEILKDENGTIIEPGNIDALSQAISFYIDNPKILFEIQKNNFQYSSKFTCEEFIYRVSEACKKVDNNVQKN